MAVHVFWIRCMEKEKILLATMIRLLTLSGNQCHRQPGGSVVSIVALPHLGPRLQHWGPITLLVGILLFLSNKENNLLYVFFFHS